MRARVQIFLKTKHENLQKEQTKKKGQKMKTNLQNMVIFCTYFEKGSPLGAILPPNRGLDLALRHLITLQI